MDWPVVFCFIRTKERLQNVHDPQRRPVKCAMKLLIHSQPSTVSPFGDGCAFIPHFTLDAITYPCDGYR